jgi:phosphohistidine phosphatase
VASKRSVEDDEAEPGQRDRFLVFLRHGIAEERTGEKPDEERSLTPEGHGRMKQIARGLEEIFPKAQAIYTSPLVRAVQTALWVSKAYRSRIKVHTSEALAPEASEKEFLQFVEGLKERRVVLVGHEPTLTSNMMALVKLKGSRHLELKKGGCYGVRVPADGAGTLEWLLSPRILRRLTE